VIVTNFDGAWLWFALSALLLLLETVIPGIYLVWLGVACSAVGIFTVLAPGAGLAIQLAVLAVSIIASVVAGQKLQKRTNKEKPNTLNLGLETYVGLGAQAVKTFQGGCGRVVVGGETYMAESATDHNISKGHELVVVGVNGMSLLVAPRNHSPMESHHA
jgi:membrane protein implicated in regulation of membrane protease activity